MANYYTIEVGGDSPTLRNAKWMAGVAVCILVFASGLVIVSTSFLQSSLYTTQATRPSQIQIQPASAIPHVQAVPQFASVTSNSWSVVAPTESMPTVQQNPLLQPLLFLAAAAAFGLGVGKMLASPQKAAILSTTAVKREWAPANGKKYKGVAPIIAPSLLAADLANLSSDSKRVMDAGADVLHVDVMDGHFVPNLSWGAPVIKCLRQHTNAFFDTHLMVSNPEDFIAPMKDAGVDQFTFHIEATKDPKALIKAIKDAGMKVGISIKPKTPVESIFPYVNDVDLILVMTVEPGFGGQSFMEDMMPKVKTLREKFPNLEIQVDGGLGPKTIDIAAKAGANVVVAGSACFVADPKSVIDVMRASLEKHLTGPGM